MMFKIKGIEEDNKVNKKSQKQMNENENVSKKISLKRKQQLEKEIEELISKLSNEDIAELENIGELNEKEIEYIKRKKRKRKSKKEIFEARIRCDEETINRIIQVGKKFAANRKQEKIAEKHREERTKNDDRTRGSGKVKQRGERI